MILQSCLTDSLSAWQSLINEVDHARDVELLKEMEAGLQNLAFQCRQRIEKRLKINQKLIVDLSALKHVS